MRLAGFRRAALAGLVLASAASRPQQAEPDWKRWIASAGIAPDFEPPGTLAEWETERQRIRAALAGLLGRLPPRPERPEVRIVSRADSAEFTLERFAFDNGAGAEVPGVLLLPRRAKRPCPAVLYCHWHGGEYDVGKEEVFQARHTPEPPGRALVRRGFAVMAIDAYGFGERNGRGAGGPSERGGAEELTSAKFNLWVGRTLFGMMLRDDAIALDLLLARPEVDPRRAGATGISLGCTRAWWLAALDERVRTGVGVCCLTRYRDLIENQGLAGHGIYYYVPGLLNRFDTEVVAALIAPRPFLFLSGELDPLAPPAGIRKIDAVARKVYALYPDAGEYRSLVFPGVGHAYTPEMWNLMLDWMARNLSP